MHVIVVPAHNKVIKFILIETIGSSKKKKQSEVTSISWQEKKKIYNRKPEQVLESSHGSMELCSNTRDLTSKETQGH